MSGKTIRETLGFLGVIASLIFVGLEIHQNTLAARAAAIQESTNVAREQVLMLATDPELNRINMIGNEEPSRLNVEEQARYRWMRVSFWWGMQGLYRQWDLGVLPNEEWQAWYRVICSTLESPGQRAFWEEQGNSVYIPQFVEIVESCDSFRGA